jgi:hypothetical protein
MSLFSLESIKIYAETVGQSSISEDVATVIAQDVEYRLRDILQVKTLCRNKKGSLKAYDSLEKEYFTDKRYQRSFILKKL